MTKTSELAEQIAGTEIDSFPKLVKVDIQVRTGGAILPPSWIKPSGASQNSKPSKE